MQTIFTPIKVKNVLFLNRIVMAPMVRFGFEYKDGAFGEKLMREYLNASNKNIGLLVGQASSVVKHDKVRSGIYDEEHVEYLATIAESCHKTGTRFFAQLAYPGFAFYDENSKRIEDLTFTEIRKIRDSFINSARLCDKAGLDGIELHGAHTYFLNMILSPDANKRHDVYGGDLLKRTALIKEIVEGIKSFTDDNFIISYRMGWNDNLKTDVETAQALEQIGVDMLHISSGIPKEREVPIPNDFNYNGIVYTGTYIKKYVNIPVIAVSGIKTAARGDNLINLNLCDFAAYGKPFLADPAFAEYSVKEINYKPCFECSKCAWYSDHSKCPARLKLKKNF